MIDQKLITFLTVIEQKTYLKAAEKLFVSQPSVTYHIKNLEKEYGITLFKNSRELELTDEGKVLYEYAKNCLIEEKELLNNFKKKDENLTLELGITHILADMKNMNNVFQVAQSNNMYFNCQTDDYESIVDRIKRGELDFGIIDHSFFDDKIDCMTILQNKIILVVKSDGKYKNLNRITREALHEATLVMGPDSSGLYDTTIQAFKNKNIKLKNKHILRGATTNIMANLVKTYDAVGFVYENCISNELENGSLKKIDLMNYEPFQNLFLIYSKNASEYTKKQIIIDFLKNNNEA